MEKEIFKEIPGFEKYAISNRGTIKNLSTGRIIKTGINKSGYEFFKISSESVNKKFYVHQMVAIVFMGHKPDGYKYVIDHINSNRLDNRVDNLRIVTHRENCSKPQERGYKSSKFTGVCFYKATNQWTSCINVNRKKVHLGYFNTEEEAHNAYQKALSSIL